MKDNVLYCKDYTSYFKDFTILDNPTFRTYSLPKKNNNLLSYGFNSNTINFTNNVHSVKHTKLKTIRCYNIETDLLDLNKQELSYLLNGIVQEIKVLGLTHLQCIQEHKDSHMMYTYQPRILYSVRGCKVLGTKDDGLIILNNFIKQKKWYKKLNKNYDFEKPFYVYHDNKNTLQSSSYVFNNWGPFLTFNRMCAWEIYYQKFSYTNTVGLEKLDLYLIEIIYKYLEEYDVKEILFRNDIEHSNNIYDKLYIKIGQKWIPNSIPKKV